MCCRISRSVSKGAQWILYRSRLFDSLADALSDVDLSVAMTRWLPDQPHSLPNLPSLLQHPTVQQIVQQPLGSIAQQMSSSMPQQQQQCQQQQQQQQQEQEQRGLHQQLSIQDGQQQAKPEQNRLPGRPVRLALVFGREEFGLSDEEVSACDLACAIPIGRLQVWHSSAQGTHRRGQFARKLSKCFASAVLYYIIHMTNHHQML